MQTLTDQIGRKVRVPACPGRVISLVPSITELVCDLGKEDTLVGITSFCVHPKHIFDSTPRVGGTKNFKIERIDRLAPDLVLANKEENPKGAVLQVAQKWPTLVTDVPTVAASVHMITLVAQALGVPEQGLELCEAQSMVLQSLEPFRQKTQKPEVLYLIWKDPYMAAGTDTFISEMLGAIGLNNVLQKKGDQGRRYPRLDLNSIADLKPDFILLSSEPYPFNQTHAAALGSLASTKCVLVNGEAFSWYGSRIAKSGRELQELAEALHGT